MLPRAPAPLGFFPISIGDGNRENMHGLDDRRLGIFPRGRWAEFRGGWECWGFFRMPWEKMKRSTGIFWKDLLGDSKEIYRDLLRSTKSCMSFGRDVQRYTMISVFLDWIPELLMSVRVRFAETL